VKIQWPFVLIGVFLLAALASVAFRLGVAYGATSKASSPATHDEKRPWSTLDSRQAESDAFQLFEKEVAKFRQGDGLTNVFSGASRSASETFRVDSEEQLFFWASDVGLTGVFQVRIANAETGRIVERYASTNRKENGQFWANLDPGSYRAEVLAGGPWKLALVQLGSESANAQPAASGSR
jgi:hypothetical protein